MTDLPPIFFPEIPRVPTLNERVNEVANEIANEVAKVTTERMVHWDADLVGIIAYLIEVLSQSGHLDRGGVLRVIETLRQTRSAEWSGGYSPLGLLADVLNQSGNNPPPVDGQQSASWLREVIEGGLSKKPVPEPAD